MKEFLSILLSTALAIVAFKAPVAAAGPSVPVKLSLPNVNLASSFPRFSAWGKGPGQKLLIGFPALTSMAERGGTTRGATLMSYYLPANFQERLETLMSANEENVQSALKAMEEDAAVAVKATTPQKNGVIVEWVKQALNLWERPRFPDSSGPVGTDAALHFPERDLSPVAKLKLTIRGEAAGANEAHRIIETFKKIDHLRIERGASETAVLEEIRDQIERATHELWRGEDALVVTRFRSLFQETELAFIRIGQLKEAIAVFQKLIDPDFAIPGDVQVRRELQDLNKKLLFNYQLFGQRFYKYKITRKFLEDPSKYFNPEERFLDTSVSRASSEEQAPAGNTAKGAGLYSEAAQAAYARLGIANMQPLHSGLEIKERPRLEEMAQLAVMQREVLEAQWKQENQMERRKLFWAVVHYPGNEIIRPLLYGIPQWFSGNLSVGPLTFVRDALSFLLNVDYGTWLEMAPRGAVDEIRRAGYLEWNAGRTLQRTLAFLQDKTSELGGEHLLVAMAGKPYLRPLWDRLKEEARQRTSGVNPNQVLKGFLARMESAEIKVNAMGGISEQGLVPVYKKAKMLWGTLALLCGIAWLLFTHLAEVREAVQLFNAWSLYLSRFFH